MAVRVACLSPYDEATVRGLFPGRDVEVVMVPEPPAQQEVFDACHLAHVVIADKRHRHKVDRRVLENMRNCILIQQAAVGFDSIDHRAAAELGIAVSNAAGYNREAVADWTLMALLNCIRMGALGDRLMREGHWPREAMLGNELGALTVGIVGLGNVGGSVARRLAGFGTTILFTDPDPERDFTGAERTELADLLERSDAVCIHTPLDVDTRGMIDAAALARMRKGTVLINAARGPLVDENALIAALETGHLAAAGLDVFEIEPLAAESQLRRMENVFISPHIGGNTVQAEARLLEMVGANLRRALDGDTPLHVVNGVMPGARR